MSTSTKSTDDAPSVDADLNIVIVRGRLGADPDLRTLPSGGVVAQFDLITQHGTAPVAWHEPTGATTKVMKAGLVVVVVGRVHRRFFRSGGRTQSRTEVVADRVIPARRAARVRSAIDVVLADLLD